jgi:hypothetical protein
LYVFLCSIFVLFFRCFSDFPNLMTQIILLVVLPFISQWTMLVESHMQQPSMLPVLWQLFSADSDLHDARLFASVHNDSFTLPVVNAALQRRRISVASRLKLGSNACKSLSAWRRVVPLNSFTVHSNTNAHISVEPGVVVNQRTAEDDSLSWAEYVQCYSQFIDFYASPTFDFREFVMRFAESERHGSPADDIDDYALKLFGHSDVHSSSMQLHRRLLQRDQRRFFNVERGTRALQTMSPLVPAAPFSPLVMFSNAAATTVRAFHSYIRFKKLSVRSPLGSLHTDITAAHESIDVGAKVFHSKWSVSLDRLVAKAWNEHPSGLLHHVHITTPSDIRVPGQPTIVNGTWSSPRAPQLPLLRALVHFKIPRVYLDFRGAVSAQDHFLVWCRSLLLSPEQVKNAPRHSSPMGALRSFLFSVTSTPTSMSAAVQKEATSTPKSAPTASSSPQSPLFENLPLPADTLNEALLRKLFILSDRFNVSTVDRKPTAPAPVPDQPVPSVKQDSIWWLAWLPKWLHGSSATFNQTKPVAAPASTKSEIGPALLRIQRWLAQALDDAHSTRRSLWNMLWRKVGPESFLQQYRAKLRGQERQFYQINVEEPVHDIEMKGLGSVPVMIIDGLTAPLASFKARQVTWCLFFPFVCFYEFHLCLLSAIDSKRIAAS